MSPASSNPTKRPLQNHHPSPVLCVCFPPPGGDPKWSSVVELLSVGGQQPSVVVDFMITEAGGGWMDGASALSRGQGGRPKWDVSERCVE